MKYQAAFLGVVVAVTGCKSPFHHNLPPAVQLSQPGPGVGGPGPGVLMYGDASIGAPVHATSQIHFVGPEGMQVHWDATGSGQFDSEPLVAPGRTNFEQGAIYRLKLTNIPARPGVELYPTLEIGPAMPRTDAYLAHNAIPFQLTDEDFDQVLTGNFVTKVIYLPDAEFQELALAGVETLVSTRLDPGVDPIVEADRRGAIMAVLRLGNKDLEVPGQEAGAGGESVLPVGYNEPISGGGPGCAPGRRGGGPYGIPTSTNLPMVAPPNVAGVTTPYWGMPMSGTPIGLPGPPHIPLGVPAGLQRHTIKNHTKVHLPDPVDHMRIDVRQRPGMSYPRPVNHIRINEEIKPRGGMFNNPWWNRNELVK